MTYGIVVLTKQGVMIVSGLTVPQTPLEPNEAPCGASVHSSDGPYSGRIMVVANGGYILEDASSIEAPPSALRAIDER